MTIPFKIDYGSVLNEAENSLNKGYYTDALRRARYCHSINPTAFSYYILAKAYLFSENYLLCMDCAYKALSGFNLSTKLRLMLFNIISKALNQQKMYMEALYFAGRSVGNALDANEDALKSVHELYSKLCSAFDSKGDFGERLRLSGSERADYNSEVYWNALDLKRHGDVEGAIHLLQSMYSGDEMYDRGMRLLSGCYYSLSQTEKCVTVNKMLFEKHPDDGQCLYEIAICGITYHQTVIRMCESFSSEDSKKVMFAAAAAHICGDNRLSTRLAFALSQKNKSILGKLLYAISLWNLGDPQGKTLFYSALENGFLRYPLSAIKKLSFPKEIALIFSELPVCFLEKLVSMVKRKVKKFSTELPNEDFKLLLIFLLTVEDNPCNCDFIFDQLEGVGTSDAVDVLKRVLVSYKGFAITKINAISLLLRLKVRGYFYMVNGTMLERKRLIVPTSYPYLPANLRSAYELAFSIMACLGMGAEKKLSMLCEDVFVVYEKLSKRLLNDYVQLGLVMVFCFFREEEVSETIYPDMFGKSSRMIICDVKRIIKLLDS